MAPSAVPGGPDLPRCAQAPPLRSAPALIGAIVASHGHSLWTDWGVFEWALAGVCGAISLWVIWLAVRHTFRPGEEAGDHVKRSILYEEDRALDPNAAAPGSPASSPPPAPGASLPPAPPSSSPPAPPPTARR